MAHPSDSVAEFQGLYGPFVCHERVLQRIWLQGDFAREQAATTDGRRIEIIAPGRWNLLGGPDFKDAQLRIGGESVTGDVEVHFHAGDWTAHGHADNPAYTNVVLHVLLFPPAPGGRPGRRRDGVELPALVLLPLLLRDLEEYASDAALEALTERADWRQLSGLAEMPVEETRASLEEHAQRRWRQKGHSAKSRIERLGWDAALHHAALEILGYRLNRAPMLAVAARFPLAAWRAGCEPEEVFRCEGLTWIRHGVRPANHPRARLKQYAAWVRARPDWPEQLAEWGRNLPAGGEDGALATSETARRELALHMRRGRVAVDVTGLAVGGSRLDNLVCDGFLPLLAAHTGRDHFAAWFHWFTGDVPGQVRRALVKLGVAGSRIQPLCHGYAQGLLGWMLANESPASR